MRAAAHGGGRVTGALDVVDVRSLLPHRYPLLLVDAVRELVPGERVVAEKAITVNEPWYSRVPDGAGRDEHQYPQALVLESWGQAAGVLVGTCEGMIEQIRDSVMLFGSASGVDYLRPVLPGDVLTHHVTIAKLFPDTVIVEGRTTVREQTVMTVDKGLMAFRPASVLRSTR